MALSSCERGFTRLHGSCTAISDLFPPPPGGGECHPGDRNCIFDPITGAGTIAPPPPPPDADTLNDPFTKIVTAIVGGGIGSAIGGALGPEIGAAAGAAVGQTLSSTLTTLLQGGDVNAINLFLSTLGQASLLGAGPSYPFSYGSAFKGVQRGLFPDVGGFGGGALTAGPYLGLGGQLAGQLLRSRKITLGQLLATGGKFVGLVG